MMRTGGRRLRVGVAWGEVETYLAGTGGNQMSVPDEDRPRFSRPVCR